MALTTGNINFTVEEYENATVAEDICPPPSAGQWIKAYVPSLQLPDGYAVAKTWTEKITNASTLLQNAKSCAVTIPTFVTRQNYIYLCMERNCSWPDDYLYYVEKEGYHTRTGKKIQAHFPYGDMDTRHFNTNLTE